jgi:hypothetical protein
VIRPLSIRPPAWENAIKNFVPTARWKKCTGRGNQKANFVPLEPTVKSLLKMDDIIHSSSLAWSYRDWFTLSLDIATKQLISEVGERSSPTIHELVNKINKLTEGRDVADSDLLQNHLAQRSTFALWKRQGVWKESQYTHIDLSDTRTELSKTDFRSDSLFDGRMKQVVSELESRTTSRVTLNALHAPASHANYKQRKNFPPRPTRALNTSDSKFNKGKGNGSHGNHKQRKGSYPGKPRSADQAQAKQSS